MNYEKLILFIVRMNNSDTSGGAFEGLNLNLLPALDALLRQRNVSRAAQQMGVSQSAMSHSLSNLRTALGDPLLVVSGRSMVATPRAEALAKALPPVLALLQETLSPPAPFDPSSARRRFRIATFDYFEVTSLPNVLEFLAVNAPGVHLDIERLGPDSAGRLERGDIDLILGGETMEMPSTIIRKLLYRDPFRVIARAEHPVLGGRLTRKRYVDLEHVVVSVEGRNAGAVDRALDEQGMSRTIALRVPHFASAVLAVAHSNLICTIASTVAERAAEWHGLRVFRVPIALPEVGIVAWWPPQLHDAPAHRWFRESLLGGAALPPNIRKLMA